MDENTQTTTMEPKVETIPEPQEKSRMEQELMRLSKEVLTQFLDGFGYVAQPDTEKAELVKAVITLRTKQVADSKKQVAESTAQIKTDADPLVTFKFMNMECPNAPLEFTYAGPKGFQKSKSGKALAAPKWVFHHNCTYHDVPYSVVKHINSLQVPADQQVQTNAEGFIQNLYSGDSSRTPRFSCTMILTPEQEQAIVNKGVK